MTKTLSVLVLESNRHGAAPAVEALEAAGHTVHRCHDEDDRGFPCRGITQADGCPLDGTIDAALVVRPRITPRPTSLEDGLTCAIRAGVPIVEDGPDFLDPFSPWVTRRVRPGFGVVDACVEAADAGFDPMRGAIIDRIGAVAAGAGITASAVSCHIDRDGSSLAVHLDLPCAVNRGVEQALAVRVLDAVHSLGHTVGNVDVHVHHP
jgi:hypothetical protein